MKKTKTPWKLIDFILFFVCFGIVTAVIKLLIYYIYTKPTGNKIDENLSYIILATASIPLAKYFLLDKYKVGLIFFFKKINTKILFITLLLTVVFAFYELYHIRIYIFLLEFARTIQESEGFKQQVVDLSAIPQRIFMFSGLVFVAPIMEEIYFRGIGQNYLVKKIGPVLAIIITAIIFTALHLDLKSFSNATSIYTAVIGRFFESLTFGLLFYKSKNLWYSTIMHSTLNLFVFSILYVIPLENLHFIYELPQF